MAIFVFLTLNRNYNYKFFSKCSCIMYFLLDWNLGSESFLLILCVIQ
jgi:hypothetical protein